MGNFVFFVWSRGVFVEKESVNLGVSVFIVWFCGVFGRDLGEGGCRDGV